ncbi:MAG: hypothetical protein ABIF01_03340 [Candidatus Micrarchaeota archaeon]
MAQKSVHPINATATRALYAFASHFSDEIKFKRAQLLIDLIPDRLTEKTKSRINYFDDTLNIWLGKSDLRKARKAESLTHSLSVSTNIKLCQSLIHPDSEKKKLLEIASQASEIHARAQQAIFTANSNFNFAVGIATANGNYRLLSTLLSNADVGQPPAGLIRPRQ